MPKTETISTLNDQFRQSFVGGQVVVTNGIAGREDIVAILKRVRTYEDFNPNNDPYGERDMGFFLATNGDQIMFRIDYYNLDMTAGSEDPASPDITRRVLTVLLSSEN